MKKKYSYFFALLKIRTDRTSARLDICYVGVFIGGDFTSSEEVVEYGFFSQDKMPLLRSNQIFLIDKALQQKGLKSRLYFVVRSRQPNLFRLWNSFNS